MSMTEEFTVTIKVVRVLSASITLRAKTQAEADQIALDRYWRQAHSADNSYGLGLPKVWTEHEPKESDPEIDTWDRCVDCREHAGYYMVTDALWAASGLGPHDGMLCLPCLAQRVRRPIEFSDFTAILPRKEDWDRYVAERDRATAPEPEQLSLLGEDGRSVALSNDDRGWLPAASALKSHR
jgi:hypothetical protein